MTLILLGEYDMHSKDVAPIVLRISLALVFLYFGFNQIYTPDSWISFVPNWIVFSGMTPNNLVILNGVLNLFLVLF